MPQPPSTLRAALAAAGPRSGAALLAPGFRLPLATALAETVMGPERPALQGRCVMLVVEDQFAAARAMLDLDGLAGRLLLCPPDLKGAHYAEVMRHADVEVIVTDRDPSLFADLAPVAIHRCDAEAMPVVPVPGEGCSTEWVLMTSGTSGVPKLVVHSLQALTAAIKPVDPAQPLVWATFYDIRRYGGLQIFLRAMLAGCTLVLSATGEPLGDHLGRLQAAGVTHLSGTPSHWRRVIMSADARTMAPGTVRLSGEIADQAVLDGLRAVFPAARIGHAYASTEAGVGFEVTDGREGFPASYLAPGGPAAMRVVDGVLHMRSDRAASRYLGPDAPPLRDAEGFVDTGDTVEQRGDRLHFTGRRNGVINVGGLKVHPEEIEAVINRHPGVRMSLVKSRRSPITGAVVVAEVVLAEGQEPEAVKAAVLQACRANLPSHKVPATVRIVPHLDVTPAGKLSRSAA